MTMILTHTRPFRKKIKSDPAMKKVESLNEAFDKSLDVLNKTFQSKVDKVQSGDELMPGVMKLVKVFVAVKRQLAPGDKMAGRHGNKGVISKIVPIEDMPYMENGKPVDVVLNPLGVPSRMNVGQILETHLGWACKEFGEEVKKLVNENNKKIEKTEKISKFLKSVYGEEIFNESSNLGRTNRPVRYSLSFCQFQFAGRNMARDAKG